MVSAAGAHPRSGRGRPAGGSEHKRAAIVRAALELFLRDGFARTSVDAIAEEAGVSKRTIYNHYGDKESLFLSVVGDTYDAMIGAVVGLMQKHLTDVPDGQVEENIIEFARAFALFAAARSSERSAIIRLMMTEAPHFPALRAVQMRPRSITGAIAERLIILDARGLLEVPDPEEAANHLFALTMGQMNNRSLFGALPLSDEDITRMATSGARTFLRAYRPS
jgi:TetR/AcrR family transcriptional regulator, mexJK operon transcriptional repressor